MSRRYYLPAALVLGLGALLLTVTSHRQPVVRGRAVGTWLERLDADAPEQRAAAREAIRELGTNALPRVMHELKCVDSNVKVFLLSLAEKQSLFEVTWKRADEHHDHAVSAFEILGTNAQAAVPELINLLASDYESWTICQALGHIGSPAIGPLAKSLEAPNPVLRRNSAEALEEFGSGAALAVPALIVCLRDQESKVRKAAASALGAIEAEPGRVVPALLPLLHDPKIDVRISAACAISHFGQQAEAAVGSLVSQLDDADEYARIAAAVALGRIGCQGDTVVPLLVNHLALATEKTRATLIGSLAGFSGHTRITLPIIFEAANGAKTEVRIAAIEALGELKNESEAVVPFLIPHLDDQEPRVRYESALALGEFGQQAASALPSLKRLLNDEQTFSYGCLGMSVCSGAQTAIAKIQVQKSPCSE